MTTPDVNIKTNQTLHKAALQAYFLEADTKEHWEGSKRLETSLLVEPHDKSKV